MKLKSFFASFFCCTLLIGCSSSEKTTSKNTLGLKPELYQGYWAMHPVNEQYRVLKFHQNGMVKIYDYDCNQYGDSYRLNEVETVYLRKSAGKTFSLLDNQKKPFAQFEILTLNAKTMRAKQSFDSDKPLFLNYTNIKGAKPLCY